jgi:hypothetical protein
MSSLPVVPVKLALVVPLGNVVQYGTVPYFTVPYRTIQYGTVMVYADYFTSYSINVKD